LRNSLFRLRKQDQNRADILRGFFYCLYPDRFRIAQDSQRKHAVIPYSFFRDAEFARVKVACRCDLTSDNKPVCFFDHYALEILNDAYAFSASAASHAMPDGMIRRLMILEL